MKVLVAGLAKTGTTGLLYLIANSFEKMPKLLFEPKECPQDIYSEEGNVVAKVLIGNLNVESFAGFDRKITLVRDPRDRIVSSLLYSQYHANYLENDDRVQLVKECLERKENNPSSVSIAEIIKTIGAASTIDDNVQRHFNHVKVALGWFDSYVDAFPESMLYRYEDFVDEKYAALEEYLNMPISGKAEVPDHFNRVKRTKDKGDWRSWFTDEDVQIFKPILSPWLEKYGYSADDWLLKPEPVIDVKHCSGYFIRLVNEAREKSATKITEGKGKSQTGRVLKVESRVVAGWAIGSNPTSPVQVVLLVNGKEIAQAVADKLRPALKERGVHETGCCGFIFKLDENTALNIGDEVIVRPIGEEFMLDNSPVVVQLP